MTRCGQQEVHKVYKTQSIDVSIDLFQQQQLPEQRVGEEQCAGITSALCAGHTRYRLPTPAVPGFDKTNQEIRAYRVNPAGVVTPSGNPFQF